MDLELRGSRALVTGDFATEAVDHLGKPEDIGRMATLLASPLSGSMNGANYRFDGGQIHSIK